MIGDENLDDLEQALESFARKEEREAEATASSLFFVYSPFRF